MTLKEKLTSLTPEQKKKFDGIKTAGQLEEFIADCILELSDEEKKGLLDYLESGKFPLTDDEMENAAGGGASNPGDRILGGDRVPIH